MELNESQMELIGFINDVNDTLKVRLGGYEYTDGCQLLHFIDDNNINQFTFNLTEKTVCCNDYLGTCVELNETQLNKLQYCLSLIIDEEKEDE